MQGLLELLDVPYVGAGVLASSLCMDKVVFKDVLAAAGVPQVRLRRRARGALARGPRRRAGRARRARPAAVRQARPPRLLGRDRPRGGGRRARRRARAGLRPRRARDRRGVLGRPRGGVRGDGPRTRPRPPCRARSCCSRAPAGTTSRPSTPTAGWSCGCPARLAPEADGRRSAGWPWRRSCASAAPGLARVDFFVEDGGRVLVNELNTLPGMTPTSAFPKLWEATGVPWPETCDRLLGWALERHASRAGGARRSERGALGRFRGEQRRLGDLHAPLVRRQLR